MIDSVAQLLYDGQVPAHSVQPVHTQTCRGQKMIRTSGKLPQDQDPAHFPEHPLPFSTWSMHSLTKAGTVLFSL